MEWQDSVSTEIEDLKKVWEKKSKGNPNGGYDYTDGNEAMDVDPSDLLIIVPDTNIWIGLPDLLKDLLNTDFDKVSYPTIVIPWMVLQELDVLMKHHKGASSVDRNNGSYKSIFDVRSSVLFIHEFLASRHPRVRGQKASEAVLAQQKYEVHNSDDRILAAALQCLENKSHLLVVFVTNDRNLLNKALVETSDNRLLVCNGNSVTEKIKASLNLGIDKEVGGRKSSLTNQTRARPGKTPIFERRTSPRRKSSSSDPDLLLRPKTTKMKNSPPTFKKPLKRLSSTSSSIELSKSKGKPMHTHSPPEPRHTKKRSASCLSQTPCVSTSWSLGEFNLKCESFQQVLVVLEKVFSYIVEFKMKEDFGERLWKHSLKYQPPWTLETALKSVIHHYFAVFSYLFGTRSKAQVESLLSLLQDYYKIPVSNINKQLEEDIVELAITLMMLVKSKSNGSNLRQDQRIIDCEQSLANYMKEHKL